MELTEDEIRSMLEISTTENLGIIHRDFSDSKQGQMILAFLSDYSRRLLNLTDACTVLRLQVHMREKKIRSLEEDVCALNEEIKELKAKKKQAKKK
jgi:hypothetical protein